MIWSASLPPAPAALSFATSPLTSPALSGPWCSLRLSGGFQLLLAALRYTRICAGYGELPPPPPALLPPRVAPPRHASDSISFAALLRPQNGPHCRAESRGASQR